MTDNNKNLHEALSNPDNDRSFKLHVLEKLDCIHSKHTKLEKDFSIFKIKTYVFVALLVSAKEAIVRKIF